MNGAGICPPLTVRDATANNLALALDLEHPKYGVDRYAVPAGPFGEFCLSIPTFAVPAVSTSAEKWAALQNLARSAGFPVP